MGQPSGDRSKEDQPKELLTDLTPAQHLAVTTPSATVCVLASAGAGKTRVLTRRVGYRVSCGTAQPEHVLAITFTRKAADELRGRLSGLGLAKPITAATFHSMAASQLKRWWADRRTPHPALLQQKVRLIAELASDRPGLRDINVGELTGHLEWAKARLVQPGSFVAATSEARRELPADAEAIASLYMRYEDEKRRRRLLDFDDLLGRYAEALQRDSRFAAAQRWRWQHVFVDELQDINPLQCRLLLAVLGDNCDFFGVGDPNQAIYGWNGADPDFLANFSERWPDAEIVHLDENHRSSPQVVAAASSALGRHAVPVRSSRTDGPLPELRSYATDDAEALGVASQLREAHARGQRWEQMAVLARTNAQVGAITQVLGREAVPFRALAPADDVDGKTDREPGLPGDRAGDVVTVCSFHRAKGLQWPAVWVCGLEAGLVPITYASSTGAVAEERRLLYVALSRAERELRCSWARERKTANGTSLRREPSPWLGALASHCGIGSDAPEVPADRPMAVDHGTIRDRAVTRWATNSRAAHPAAKQPVADLDGELPETTVLRSLASARRRLAGTHLRGQRADPAHDDPAVTAVAGRLREWRRRLARASGVPPHVLLHDSTVTAIAIRRPSNAEDLLAVPGIGPVKVARFGPGILKAVQEDDVPVAVAES